MLCVFSLSRSASAQTDKAGAEALFQEGMRLTKAGKNAEACPKFEESQRLEPSLGVQYYLADCFEKVGRTASAWANFIEVANKAKAMGEKAKEQTARKRADELEPKLSRLSIEVTDAQLPGLTVMRGSAALGSGQWGVALPVDPGSYDLHASAPGYKDWTKTVEVKAGASVTEKVPVLEAAPAAPVAATTSPAASNETTSSTALPPADAPAPKSPQRTIGLVVGAVGVVALATSGALALMAKSANTASKGEGFCGADDSCTDAGLDKRDHALRLADAATFVSITGAVLTAGGAVIWLTAPSSHREPGPTAQLGIGGSSVVLRGQF
jgi:hypothetical protein